MRIAVVHSFYSSAQPSGENSVVMDQVAALQSAGHDVRLIGRHTDDASSAPLYPVRSALTTITGRGPSPAPQLAAFRPDVVHVHNTFPNWGTSWTRKWADRLVVTVHNYRPMCAAGTLLRDGKHCEDCLDTPVKPAVQHGCYRGSSVASVPVALGAAPAGPLRQLVVRAAEIVTLNPDSQRIYSRVLQRQVALVPNAVPSGVPVKEQHDGRWVYVGRMAPEKGVLELVANWRGPAVLELIGDGPLAAEAEALARSSPVVVFTGRLSREAVLRKLASVTAVVLPSLWSEGLPTVLIEGFARGVPAIVSRSVAAGSELEASEAALLFDPRDAGDIERAVREVQLRRSKMSSAAQALHSREYSPAVWVRRMTEVYEQVVGAQ